jgi:hypothetical protein
MRTGSILIMLAVLVLGCAEVENDERRPMEEQGIKSMSISDDSTILSESVPKFAPVAGFGDGASMAAKIEEVIGEPLGADAEVTATTVAAETEAFVVDVDAERGAFLIRAKATFPMVESDGWASREEVFTAAENVLNTLGVTDAETATTADLHGQFKAIDGEPEEPVALARKVFVDRTIGGVPVLGDRLVVSFGMDGSFRGLHGRWTPVDVAGSVLEVAMDTGEIEALVAGSMGYGAETTAMVRTVLVPDGIESLAEEGDVGPYPKALRLAWEAGVDTMGPDGPSFTAWQIVRPPVAAKEVGE